MSFKWTSVEKDLPPGKTEVLASFDDGTVKILWQDWRNGQISNYPGEPLAYIKDGMFPQLDRKWDEAKTYVLAWAPVPDPYRKEAT